MWRIFDQWGAAANRRDGGVKCSASELLTLYGLLRHWVETSLPSRDARVEPYLKCFLMACAALDVLAMAKRGEVDMSDASARLRTILADLVVAQMALHGAKSVKPKTHWAFDVADRLANDEWLFDAFVIERLHLRVKAVT